MTSQLILNKLKVLKLHFQKLGLFNLSGYIIQRTFKQHAKIIRIRIPDYLHPVYLRNTQSDTQIFTHIFLREELKVELNEIPRIIIEGGANIGLSTLYLRRKYPDALIFAVEPDKSNFEMLIKNTNPYKNIICYNSGLWDKNAKLKIVNKNAGNESFIVSELTDTDEIDDAIEAITISEIVKRNNISKIGLLKLDIEGSEGKIFANNYSDWLSITDNMLVEIHNWIDSNAEKTVMNAVAQDFKNKMAGEYHFFFRINEKVC
jgi:FkbM family methyltransferase